jgi:hypothetical protein
MNEIDNKRVWIRQHDIVAIGVFAVLSFAIDSTIGLILQPILVAKFGPLTGGIVSAIPNAIVIFLGVFLIPRIGAPTLYATIFLSFTVFTTSFGPPGFHKIFIGIMLGLTIDIIVFIFRGKLYSYFIAIPIAFGLSVYYTYLSWVMFSVGSAVDIKKELEPNLIHLIIIYAILGLIGTFISYNIYKIRLSGYEVINKLRNGD